jgi:hypothetical protein
MRSIRVFFGTRKSPSACGPPPATGHFDAGGEYSVKYMGAFVDYPSIGGL